jgi:DNA (cytosine-5)-methyltransferase 1
VRYLSVCSGIESASCAWESLKWTPAAFAEIAPFPSAVLAHRWPSVLNVGDFTQIKGTEFGHVDLLVGGTPCQDFSNAGKRAGLSGSRGQLALDFFRLVDRLKPRWLVWENVAGLLSSNEGRDFGAVLGALAECGYGFAYRILDAQNFGVPQRRRRIFLIGYFGDWRPPAAVLFEPESLRGDIKARRKSRAVVAALTATGVGACGADDNQAQAGHLIPFGGNNTRGPIEVAPAVRAKGGTGHGDFRSEAFIAFSCKDHGQDAGPLSPTLRAMDAAPGRPNGGGQVAVVEPEPVSVALRGREGGQSLELGDERANCLSTGGGGADRGGFVLQNWRVRRITPMEAERLQGFRDDYTRIPWKGKSAALCPDGPRYRAIGNSKAIPVVWWVGQRIELVDKCPHLFDLGPVPDQIDELT